MVAWLALPLCLIAVPQDEVEWHNYQPILNASFPIARKLGLYVGYRYSHMSFQGDLEYSFIIGSRPRTAALGLERTLTAEIRVADTTTIYEQLTALHHQNPQVPFDDLRTKLKVKYILLTEKECPAVRRQFEKFKKLKFSSPGFDLITLDQPSYEFQINASQGEMTLLSFDYRTPLVHWAMETRRDLDSCIRSVPTSKGPKDATGATSVD